MTDPIKEPETIAELHILAIAGDADSQCEMGDLHNRRAIPMTFYPDGPLEKNDEIAEFWYNAAACNGCTVAIEQLKDMR